MATQEKLAKAQARFERWLRKLKRAANEVDKAQRTIKRLQRVRDAQRELAEVADMRAASNRALAQSVERAQK